MKFVGDVPRLGELPRLLRFYCKPCGFAETQVEDKTLPSRPLRSSGVNSLIS